MRKATAAEEREVSAMIAEARVGPVWDGEYVRVVAGTKFKITPVELAKWYLEEAPKAFYRLDTVAEAWAYGRGVGRAELAARLLRVAGAPVPTPEEVFEVAKTFFPAEKLLPFEGRVPPSQRFRGGWVDRVAK